MPIKDWLDSVHTEFLYDSGDYPIVIEDWRFDDRVGQHKILKFTALCRFAPDSPKYAGKQAYVGLFMGTKADPDCEDPKTPEKAGGHRTAKEILEATGKRERGKTLEDQLLACKLLPLNLKITTKVNDGKRKDDAGNVYIDEDYAGKPENKFFFGKRKASYAKAADASGQAVGAPAPMAAPATDDIDVID